MTPEPQGLSRQRKIRRMVAVRRKSDRPAVIFSITTYYYYGQTRYPIVRKMKIRSKIGITRDSGLLDDFIRFMIERIALSGSGCLQCNLAH